MFVGKMVDGEVVPMGAPVPEVGLVVAICNAASAFYGRLARVERVHADGRTVYVTFIVPDSDGERVMAYPFGASEVVALAPGELQEMFGK